MSGAAGAAGAAAGTGGGGSGGNEFWEVTNLFSQKNRQGAVTGLQLSTSTADGGGQINPGNFLRGVRLAVRTSVPGTGGAAQPDGAGNFFKQLGLENVDGSEILYNVIGGYAYLQRHRFGRPWLQDPTQAYDYLYDGNSISFTLPLFPEVRQQLGVLENTDTRSQFNWTQTIATSTTVQGGAVSAGATVNVIPYVDMWAQPDAEDLEKTPNQQIPLGTNLQTKTRHQTFTLNGAGSDNNFLSTLTGNAVRWALLIVRDSNGARQDYLTDPIQWQLDQRNLGTLSPDIVFQWAEDFYRTYGGVRRPTGVYPFPRFYDPGSLYGQGWLYTANSTTLYWESSTNANGANLPGTCELLQEEVYATGPVDPSLISL